MTKEFSNHYLPKSYAEQPCFRAFGIGIFNEESSILEILYQKTNHRFRRISL